MNSDINPIEGGRRLAGRTGQTSSELPKITVITTAFNACQGVADTIDNVRQQDYPNLEHVVIDGGGPDGTAQMLRARDQEVDYWRSERDAGMADGFNKGTSYATGDAVIYMNAGDFFYAPDTLSRLVELAGRHISLRDRIVYGDAWILGEHEQFCMVGDHKRIETRPAVCHQAALIGIDLAREFPYDNRFIVDADQDFWLRCMRRYGTDIFQRVDLKICRYALGGASNDPKWAEHNFISQHLSRMLNNGRGKHTLRSLCLAPAKQILEYRIKVSLRKLLGLRFYLGLKGMFRPQSEVSQVKPERV